MIIRLSICGIGRRLGGISMWHGIDYFIQNGKTRLFPQPLILINYMRPSICVMNKRQECEMK